jgi:hypothetical protein
MEISIAVISLVLSVFTLWVTYIHRGKLTMTRPTIIAFAFENNGIPKIFLRTLLCSSSKQGIIVESMFLKVSNSNSVQNFSVWAYGDKGLVRGSGLHIGEAGVEVNHHFIIPRSDKYVFKPGTYSLQMFCTYRNKPRLIYEVQLDLNEKLVAILNNGVLGVFFDWNPEKNDYDSYVEDITPEKFVRLVT